MKVTRPRESPHAALGFAERDEGMTRWNEAYKWAAATSQLIQSVLLLLTSLLLKAWSWTASTARSSLLSAFSTSTHTWTALWATMTIEVVATTETLDPASLPPLPILRLNSETMEDYLPARTDDLFSSGRSNYNSSDGEHDSGLVLSEPEEHELSDGVQFASRIPQEPYVTRRDSDSSDTSSSDGQDEKGMSDEVSEKLISQVETMFSDDHLAKDGFLLKHVRRRSDGFVSLKLVAGLRKVKQISRDFPVVLSALRKSSKLEINTEGTKVRRADPLTPYLKALPTTTGNKEKDTASSPKSTNGASSDSAQDDMLNRVRNNYPNQTNNGINGFHKKIQRNNSNASTGSSNGSSRHSSFSSPYHPSELMYRNMMAYAPVSMNEENPQVIRRRGGSLPIPMMMTTAGQQYLHQQQYYPHPQQRNSMYLSPNSSPPNSADIRPRPKSNSYCEGTSGPASANGGMSLWLQRRHASSRNSSEGSVVISGVLRQPRGPDGSKGFSQGYRQLIIKEKDEAQATISALSA